jgi:2-polyprenyl-3-methyl-5-hydroxy-6-metoxy-1,4-benzoquinol methylase
MSDRAPRIGILVVAYNAATTLAGVLDRIPASFRPKIAMVFVCDDHSQDATYLVGLGYKQVTDLPLMLVRHPKNLGYGGNQKAGYQLAIEHDLDIIVLLHGDGQYAPECIESIVEPLVRGEAHAVFGSRMMVPGDARKGGMPLYKYVGNRILTKIENAVLGTEYTEFHSGYRAYSVAALAAVPFNENSDGFEFDTEIICQFVAAGRRIVEVPIPTYYGDEICYVNGLAYAKNVVGAVLRHRLHSMGFGVSDTTAPSDEYHLKEGEESSHRQIISWMKNFPPSRVLDLGCSGGRLGERLYQQGHHVTGVEIEAIAGTARRVDRLIVADLDEGIPPEAGTGYDVVIAADVLEHLRDPDRVLAEIRRVLAPHGSLLLSVPNFAHWYPRTRVALGLFDYDARGILDRGHVRFFTRRSLQRLVTRSGWSISRIDYTGLPFDVLTGGASSTRRKRALRRLDRVLVRLRPPMFAYQFLLHLHPVGEPGAASRHDDETSRPAAAAAS